MLTSEKIKERFCKDCNIPIKLFQEPYFADRLKLYNRFYHTIEKWNIFTQELKKYPCEQDYFEEYNRVKDTAITDIKSTKAYREFNRMNMFPCVIKNDDLPNKDIFKTTNDGKCFISIDMEKANFSALRIYDPSMFDNAKSWEEFMKKYTKNNHIINSKYIRQVILGNCNPKRHITYEKYQMDHVLNYITKTLRLITTDHIVFFSNDEIVIDISDMPEKEQIALTDEIDNIGCMPIPLKVERFILHKIIGTNGYCKEIRDENNNVEIEFKCMNNYELPFVLRKFQGQEITESDKVFFHEGLLAKFIEIPDIRIPTII